jgi:hypothetical protein
MGMFMIEIAVESNKKDCVSPENFFQIELKSIWAILNTIRHHAAIFSLNVFLSIHDFF